MENMVIEFEFFDPNLTRFVITNLTTNRVPRIGESFEYEDENGKSFFGEVKQVQTYYKKYIDGNTKEQITVKVKL